MRSAILLLALFAAASAAAVGPVKAVGKDWLPRQGDVLRLFAKLQQPLILPEHEELMKDFHWQAITDKFKDPHTLEHFMGLYEAGGFLARNEDFSMNYVKHFKQAKEIFKVLISARDYDTFHKMAVWMRYHLNSRMFSYVLGTVLQIREDTSGITVPPSYEVFPQYFVTSDAMERAYDAHMRGLCTKQNDPCIIAANYTGFPEANDAEARLSYYREDIGLNSFIEAIGRQYPFWISRSDAPSHYIENRGNIIYFMIRNMVPRYDAERYANGLPPVEPVKWGQPVKEGYDPTIRHVSGRAVPARPEGLVPQDTEFLTVEDVMDWERRIRDSISVGTFLDGHMQVKTLTPEEAMNKICSILAGADDSPNPIYYGSAIMGLYTVFGRIMDPHYKYTMAPPVMHMPDTMARDPLFFRISKRILNIIDLYKKSLAPYGKEDVVIPGLEIESMKIDKLITFFDDFDIHLENAITMETIKDERNVNVIARQHRLNHKPFSYTMKISSDKERTALVRVFLGPRVDWSSSQYTEDDSRQRFYMLEAFDIKLKAGVNTIVRNSREMLVAAEDPLGIRQMFDKVASLLAGQEELQPGYNLRLLAGNPRRLLLPRGWNQGLPMTVFAVVTDDSDRARRELVFLDGHDAFFPFDRRVSFSELRTVPNAHFEDVNIYHRRAEDVNISPE